MGDETVKIMKTELFHDLQLSNNDPQKKKLIYLAVAVTAYILVALFVFGQSLPNHYMPNEKGAHFATLETKDGSYAGQVFNLAYEGEGTFQYLKGGNYQGKFSHSKREGEGLFTWANGDSYLGKWKADAMETGVYVFADGRTYSGTFQNNQYGNGTFDLGKAAANYGFVSYKAELENGKVTKLSFQKTDGTTYEGDKDGTAKITYADGNTYEGEVADGKRSGKGVFTWKQGGTTVAKYDGQWSDDQMDGTGTYYYSDSDYPKIEGTFKNGNLEGAATYYKNATKKFKTQWSNGSCTNNDVQ